MTKQAKLKLLMGFYRTKGFSFSWKQIEVIQRAASAISALGAGKKSEKLKALEVARRILETYKDYTNG